MLEGEQKITVLLYVFHQRSDQAEGEQLDGIIKSLGCLGGTVFLMFTCILICIINWVEREGWR